eukprot:CAMPEP_0196655854 /NCGR_PEP_ID=MMETSP1086-20130531/9987_1 /TAXON_ID=77921 /ORGANISM="Cyanoptyche  gloeocystis , Strain SAG4.97" /LENGTH=192 /DNA_ID=CAMNT_0041988377 /DNA_START=347 /DNA_END=922 /DNA_ORIENTATION=-
MASGPQVLTRQGPLDIWSRLYNDRIVILGTNVDDMIANTIVAQLLWLAAVDPEKDITLLINSPGGSVTAGLAIYDAMNYIQPDVRTVCMGLAASMGAFLLSGGTKGKRYSLPNARIMIHQPLGGAQGTTEDVDIQVREIMFHKKTLTQMLAEHTGQPIEKILSDTERDFFMSPYDAQRYGLIDEVLDITYPW